MKRVVILGASGAGKSTFSAELSKRIGAAHIDRDKLWSGRVPMESPEFRSAVEEAIAAGNWVFDGMPFYVEDVVFAGQIRLSVSTIRNLSSCAAL